MQAPAPQQSSPAPNQAAVKRARSSGSHKKAAPAPSEAAIAGAKASVARINNERDDKLWISGSDPYLEQTPSENMMPLDFEKILRTSIMNAGLTPNDITPIVANGLLEHVKVYAWHLVADAQDFAMHRKSSLNPQITGPDLLLAVQNQSDRSSKQRDRLAAFQEEEVNLVPLPRIPNDCYTGVVLPPLEHTLLARTYDIIPSTMLASTSSKGVNDRSSVPIKRRRSSKSKIDIKLKNAAITSSTESKKSTVTTEVSSGVKRKADGSTANE